MDDHTQVWLAAIAIIPVTIAAMTSALLAWRGNQTGAALVKIANDTHTLVNNNMSIALEANYSVTRRLALLTKDPVDVDAAAEAKKKLDDHLKQQKVVDIRNAELSR